MGGFCDSGQSQTNNTGWADSLGPTSIRKNGKAVFSPTGAPAIRTTLFNYLKGYTPQMTSSGEATADALKAAAANSGWQSAEANARQNAAGAYLNGSPQLDRSMAWNRAANVSSAADEAARIRSAYTKTGTNFSTAHQQAEQANNAAANAASATNSANTYAQNYIAERANQNNAPAQLSAAVGAPLQYLSGVPGAYTAPLASAGNLLSALSSGGQTFTAGSSGSYNPSLGSSILNGLSAV